MKKNMRILIMLFTLCCVILVSSCATTPVSVTASNTPLHDKIIAENLGKVEGKTDLLTFQGFSILGVWMLGKPDIQEALDNALAQKKADALINIKCYETYYYFLFGSITQVVIEGEAVKFIKITSDGTNFDSGY